MTPAPDATVRYTDTGIVLVNASSGDVFASNHVGAALWRLLADGQSIEAMAASIAETYNVSLDTARTDVAEFLDELRASSLIVEE